MEEPEALLAVPGFRSRYAEEVEVQLQVFDYWSPRQKVRTPPSRRGKRRKEEEASTVRAERRQRRPGVQ